MRHACAWRPRIDRGGGGRAPPQLHPRARERERERARGPAWSVDNLEQARALDELVDLAHGRLRGQRAQVGHEVVHLRVEQRRGLLVLHRLLPERADVHARDLGRLDDLNERRRGAGRGAPLHSARGQAARPPRGGGEGAVGGGEGVRNREAGPRDPGGAVARARGDPRAPCRATT